MGGTRLREEKGQATVELAVMLPVAIVDFSRKVLPSLMMLPTAIVLTMIS